MMLHDRDITTVDLLNQARGRVEWLLSEIAIMERHLEGGGWHGGVTGAWYSINEATRKRYQKVITDYQGEIESLRRAIARESKGARHGL